MLITLSKLLRSFPNFDPHMLGHELISLIMLLLITLETKCRFVRFAVNLGITLITKLTHWRFEKFFFVVIENEVDYVAGEYLGVIIQYIIMLKQPTILFLFIIQRN